MCKQFIMLTHKLNFWIARFVTKHHMIWWKLACVASVSVGRKNLRKRLLCRLMKASKVCHNFVPGSLCWAIQDGDDLAGWLNTVSIKKLKIWYRRSKIFTFQHTAVAFDPQAAISPAAILLQLMLNTTLLSGAMVTFLVLRKALLISHCVQVWLLFVVFRIFCLTALVITTSVTPRNCPSALKQNKAPLRIFISL